MVVIFCGATIPCGTWKLICWYPPSSATASIGAGTPPTSTDIPPRFIGNGLTSAVTIPSTCRPMQKIAPIEPAGGNPPWKLAEDVTTMFCGIWPHTTETKKAASKRRNVAGPFTFR